MDVRELVNINNTSHLPLKMEQIECSETSAYINQTPGNHPKENKQHSEHGESLKSRTHYRHSENKRLQKRGPYFIFCQVIPSHVFKGTSDRPLL